jgi:NitT/TauT family transport system substrate-binding protein
MKQLIPTLLAATLALAAPAANAATQSLVIAEPVHSIGYLPLYVAVKEGFFAAEGLDVKVTTIDSGSGHTNAVLSGQAFGFVGGPEHDAFAKAKGGELRSVVNMVDRGNVYLVAGKKAMPTGNVVDFVKGKKIATLFYGGTPNSIMRYLLAKWHLDMKKDVTLLEVSNPAIYAAVKTGQADIGVVTEPYIAQGIKEGLWTDAFYNVPKELGPYAYSTINIRLESIKKDPKTVEGFVRAIIKGLRLTYDKPEEALAVAKTEFPTMEAADLKASIDRSFKDEVWSHDGMISRAAWDTGKAVVMEAGILKQDVPYDDIIDMQFVERLKAAKN